MTDGEMLVIQVPASTANLGPGFDSVGLALNLYLTLEIERASKWEVVMESEELNVFPKNESNFIIQTSLSVARKYGADLHPCRIKMRSDIPLTRGLGSSGAAIIAAIELADHLAELGMSKKEKLKLACDIEGHPDNVGASLYGGLIIGSQEDEEINIINSHSLSFGVIAAVPKKELLTKESRAVLPNDISFSYAVKASSISNVFVAALLSSNYPLAGKMMRKDLFHQPFRMKLVPHFQELEKIALEAGAFGVALSGAGPTVICCVENCKRQYLLSQLEKEMPELNYLNLKVDHSGSTVFKKSPVS